MHMLSSETVNHNETTPEHAGSKWTNQSCPQEDPEDCAHNRTKSSSGGVNQSLKGHGKFQQRNIEADAKRQTKGNQSIQHLHKLVS